jgi:hypothetical protein
MDRWPNVNRSLKRIRIPDPMAPHARSWLALDLIGVACDEYGKPTWREERKLRARRTARPLPQSDRDFLRHFAIAIAFSQSSRSSIIRTLVQSPEFDNAFEDFDPHKLSQRDPSEIVSTHWYLVKHIRFRGKITSTVNCARVVVKIAAEHGSFVAYLRSFRIPRRLHTASDIERFWTEFERLRRDLRIRAMPFFGSTTSLLQLLLDLDYDSVKPDLIVMRLARRIGIVDRETGDRALRSAARLVQEYAVARAVRAPLVDLQLLAFGGQTGSRDLLRERFCPPSDPCSAMGCPVGKQGLCEAFRA